MNKSLLKSKSFRNAVIARVSELLIVAFGVFLGIIVSDIRSQKRTDQNTERALSFIMEEIATNIQQVESSIAYQTVLFKDSDNLTEELDSSDYHASWLLSNKLRFNKVEGYQGLGFPALKSVMYESARLNGTFQELNITTTQIVSSLYQNQQKFERLRRQLNDRLININSESKVIDVVAILEFAKYDGFSFEKKLLADMQQAWDYLKKTKHTKRYRT